MKKHSRALSAVVLVGALGGGLGLLGAMGQFREKELSGMSVEELEKRIGEADGAKDKAVWMAYGEKLRAGGKFGAAAKAFEKAMTLDPELAEGRLMAGVSLAEAKDADGFFGWVAKLSINVPKAAVDLMERPEVQGMRGDARWTPAEAGAKAQAVD